jgi:hypothetical protein
MKAGALIASLPLAGRVGRAKRRPGWGSPGRAFNNESTASRHPHPAGLTAVHPPHKGEGEKGAGADAI